MSDLDESEDGSCYIKVCAKLRLIIRYFPQLTGAAPTLAQFRFGRSIISGTGETIDGHPNVLRLTVLRSPFEQTLIALALRLPTFLQALIAILAPGLFLPQRIVLKKPKPGWQEEFENEKIMFQRLQSLQGHEIPKYYGEAKLEGTCALVLSEVVGIMPWEQFPPLPADEFKALVEVVFEKINAFGLAYDDVNLDNMILVDDQVVLVDLESLYEPLVEEREYVFSSDRRQLMVVYNRYLDNISDDDI